MKSILITIMITLSVSSTLLADKPIYELGRVNVLEVKYVQKGEFIVTLSKIAEPSTKNSEVFFTGKPRISFVFHPDQLDGTFVTVTGTKVGITRKDIGLTGPMFINQLMSKMAKGENINLSCGLTSIKSGNSKEIKRYLLSYFQVNNEIK